MESRKRLSFAVPLLLLFLSVFINYIDRGNLSIAAPLLRNELGISASQLGILLAAFFWTYTAMQFVCGWLVDRFDVNRVLAVGYLVWSLATVATGLVHGFAMLLAMRLALGVGESVAFPCYSKILARHLLEHRRGFANGVIGAGIKCGPAVGALGAGLLMADYGWRPVFIGIGLLSLAWLPAWMKWMPCVEALTHSGVCPHVVEILRQRSFWGACAGQFCGAYYLYFILAWLPFYLVQEHQLAMEHMVKITALYYLVDAGAAVATGWLADFFIGRGFTTTIVRKSAMAFGWTTAAIGLAGCGLGSPAFYLGWLMLSAVGNGMGISGTFAFSQTLAGPQAAGRWVGLQNGVGNLAGVIGPALTGFLVDWTGHFQAAVALTAAMSLLSAICYVFFVGSVRQVVWTSPGEIDLVPAVPEIV
jgi:ACS family D-galactonate transporter-like MFS transporter